MIVHRSGHAVTLLADSSLHHKRTEWVQRLELDNIYSQVFAITDNNRSLAPSMKRIFCSKIDICRDNFDLRFLYED